MGIKDELAALNRQFELGLRARAEALENNPVEKRRVEASMQKAHIEAQRSWRPRRPEGEPGQRFRFPSRSKGAMDRRRRAQHAAQSLPWHYRANYELTEAEILVLSTHYRNADDKGTWSPSIAELASRAGVSSRAAQMANRHLQALGLLTIQERRETPFRNQPNIYTLDEDLRRSHKGAKPCAPKGESISSRKVLGPEGAEGTKTPPPANMGAISARVKSKPLPGWEWVANFGRQHSSASDVELKVARLANRLLDEDQPAMANEALLWSRGAALVEEYAPKTYGNLLARGIRNHGFKALLAIFETALLSRCGHVEKGHGYLWGVLRKSADECNPHVTLSRLFASRRMPGLLHDQALRAAAGTGWWMSRALEGDGAGAARDRLRAERAHGPALPRPA